MKYIIHNKNLIGDLEQQDLFEQNISRKIKLLERVLSNYKKNILLEVYVSKSNSHLYKVSLSLKLKSKLIYIEEKGKNIFTLVNDQLEKLRNIVKSQIVKERKEHVYKRKQRRTESFAEHALKLNTYYLQKDKEQFDHLAKKLIPILSTYILRYLKTHGHDIKLDISTQELLDEAYINLFDRYHEKPEKINDLTSWIYGITREFLEKYLQENAVHKEQLDISILASRELKSLEEKIAIDADGEFILLEDLDDISYRSDHYGLEVFPENAFIDNPELHPLTEDIKKALESCDEKDQMIFEMFWLDELSENEISRSMGIEKAQVKKIINNVTKKIVAHIESHSL